MVVVLQTAIQKTNSFPGLYPFELGEVLRTRLIKKVKEFSKKFHYPRVSLDEQLLSKSRRNCGLEMVLDLDESSAEPGGLIAKKKIGWCAEAFSLALVASARRGRGIGNIRRALKPARAARGRGEGG